jgi:hypothetical protein
MKVRVTHLKAPWPAGTVPGHVVELTGCDTIPAWAVGKCEPAADDAEAVSSWARPAAVVPAELGAQPEAEAAGELVANPADEAQAAAGSAEGSEPAAAPAAPARKTARAQAAAG